MSEARATLGVWGAVMILAAVLLLALGSVRSDLSAFLPRSGDPALKLLLGQLQRGPASNLLLIGIRGENAAGAAAVSDALADGLERSGRFRTVANGSGHLHPDPWVKRYRYLLSDRVDRAYFSVRNLHAAFSDLIDRMRDPGTLVDTAEAAADPTGEYRYLLAQWGRDGPPRRHGVWMTDDDTALLLATTRAQGGNIDAMAQALSTARDAFAAAPHDGSAQLVLGGAPAIAVATRDTVRSEAQRLTAWAGAALLLLLLIVLRSPLSIAVATVPVLSGFLVAAAVVVTVFDGIHGITLAFGATLLGICVDYPLHLLGHVDGGDVRASARRIRQPLFVGAVTTALGFSALILAGFRGLVQLGLFSVVGVMTAALVTYSVLPALLGHRALPSPRLPVLPSAPRRVARWTPPLAIALGLVGTLLGWRGAALTTDITGLTPIPPALGQADRAFRRSLNVGDARYVILVPGKSREQALARSATVCNRLETLATADRIGGFDCASTYLPSVAEQRRRQSLLPTAAVLRQRVEQATRGLPLRADALAPFVQAVATSRTLEPMRVSDLGEGPVAERVGAMLHEYGGTWFSLIRLRGIDQRADAALSAAAMSAPGGRLVDLKRTAEEAIAGYERAAVRHCLAGSLAILLLLALTLRNATRLYRVAAVAFGAMGTALGAIALTSATVTLFQLVSLLLTVGLGLDYALFTTQPRQRGEGAQSVTVCALSTLIAFGILATSALPVLKQIGGTVFIGAAAAWVLALLVAPA